MQWDFGPFRLDLNNACLWRAEQSVPLRPKTLALLAYLVAHAGQLVTKEALLDAVWSETAVGDGVLKTSMAELRKALGETAQAPRWITTVQRRGYRFAGPVTAKTPSVIPEVTPEATAPALPAAPASPAAPVPADDQLAGVLTRREAERRQLTVLFCDLVDSTVLASQLDPEDFQEVVQAYYQICAEVVTRFTGYIAQYLGDGILVYFGYPLMHEDAAQRAIRAGLDLLAALALLNRRLARSYQVQLQARIGIHTGLTVVEASDAGRQAPLAWGATPHLAARLQTLASPNTVVISDHTYRLVQGYFIVEDQGQHPLPGFASPVQVYWVRQESGVHNRFEVATWRGLTPLVGREQELSLLCDRWERVKEGQGQVILLSGEAGIGKSRLVEAMQDHIGRETSRRMTWSCSPFFQQTPLYPVQGYLHRELALRSDESPHAQFSKLEAALAPYSGALQDTLPLFAALLSIPLPDHYAAPVLSAQKQKEQTLASVLAWLLAEAARQPVLLIVEDLHWVDPTTLALLDLVVDQGPTARLGSLFTFRPDFVPPWRARSHITSVMLGRLLPHQAKHMVERITGGKVLPLEVLHQIVAKTDGVPLFVEEWTKMVLESGWLREVDSGYALKGPLPPMAIPTTLQDLLMARLDRLAPGKAVAQLGAAIGRQFAYELLQAVAPFDEVTLHHGLRQLVEAELLYQRGVLPQATYVFKHALIQEAAYQSLLKQTRQHYHEQIAYAFQAPFADIVTSQPELVAHHYTEAGQLELAIGYWHKAGQNASARSANEEALSHLTRGLDLLRSLPETAERALQELNLLTALGPVLVATRGFATQETAHVYGRAYALCQQVGDTPQLFPVLWGLWLFYTDQGGSTTSVELGERLLRLAQQTEDKALLLQAHHALGNTRFWDGEFAAALHHMRQCLALYDPQQHQHHARIYGGHDPAVCCLAFASLALWLCGYPDQARQHSQEALHLAQTLRHPNSLAHARLAAFRLQALSADGPEPSLLAQADELIALATQQGFTQRAAGTRFWRGWALAAQENWAAGIAEMRQSVTAYQAAGFYVPLLVLLALLAQAHGKSGQVREGLAVLDEALGIVQHYGNRDYEAELYRLRGELLLLMGEGHILEASHCFHAALDVARRQQAKTLELRAAVSLSRLWQRQHKRREARDLLAPIYHWFTEGFDTLDLREAQELLEVLHA